MKKITTIALVAIALAVTMLGSGCSAANDPINDTRFKVEETDVTAYSLWTDTETKVVYLLWEGGVGQGSYAGVTPLLDENGQPATTADTELTKVSDGRFQSYPEIAERNAETVIDTLTGVVYVRFQSGVGKGSIAGLSALIGADGKPVIDTEYAQSAN